MRLLFTFCLTFFSILTTQSFGKVQKNSQYNYRKHWTEYKINNPHAPIKLFTKKSPVKNLDVIATVTVTENNTASKDEVFSIIKKSLDGTVWSEDKIDNVEFIETLDSASSTLYRVGFNLKTKQFSVASVRTRNLLPSYLEVHLLQIEKLTGTKSTKTSQWMFDLFVSKAYAQSLGGRIQAGITQTGRDILSPTNTSIDGVASSIDGASGALDRHSAIVDAAGNRLSGSVDRIEGSISKQLSASNVAKLTAVGALSATLTSTLTTFVINGTWLAAKKLYYEVAGQFTKEERQERIDLFEKSFKEYADLSPKMTDLNKRIDIFSSHLNSLAKTGSAETILAQIDSDIAKVKIVKTEAGSVCTSGECLNQEKLLELKALEDIRRVIASAGGDVQKKTGAICGQLDSMYMSYVDAELRLTAARGHIVDNTPIFMGAVNKISEVSTVMQQKRKSTNACLESIESQIGSLASSARTESCDSPENSQRTTCQQWKNLQRQKRLCESTKDIQVTEDFKLSLSESALDFNENVANFSRMLGALDCSKSENGTCIEPGPFRESKAQVKSNMTLASQQCQNSVFSKSFASAQSAGPTQAAQTYSARALASDSQAPVVARMVAASAPVATERPLTFWDRVKNFFTFKPRLIDETNRYHESMYSGGN